MKRIFFGALWAFAKSRMASQTALRSGDPAFGVYGIWAKAGHGQYRITAKTAATEHHAPGILLEVTTCFMHVLFKALVSFDEKEKAAMVGNRFLALCGATQADPVINTGMLGLVAF